MTPEERAARLADDLLTAGKVPILTADAREMIASAIRDAEDELAAFIATTTHAVAGKVDALYPDSDSSHAAQLVGAAVGAAQGVANRIPSLVALKRRIDAAPKVTP